MYMDGCESKNDNSGLIFDLKKSFSRDQV